MKNAAASDKVVWGMKLFLADQVKPSAVCDSDKHAGCDAQVHANLRKMARLLVAL